MGSNPERPQVVEVSDTYGTAFGGRLLAESGIPVLRIETAPRSLLQDVPPFGPAGRSVSDLSANLKKATVRIDVDAPGGAELLERLVASADAFLTDRRQLWDLRARTVSCRVRALPEPFDAARGYELPSYGVPVQAQSGAISMTGRIGGPPVPIGFPIADIAPGVYAAIGILQGLLDGRPRAISVDALDSTVSLLSYLGCSFIAAGEEPGFIGSGHPHIVPYGAFPAKDGYIIVAGFTQDFWRNLCHMFDRADLIENPRYRNFVDRRDNRDELNGLIADMFMEGTVEHWIERLDEADVPNAPIYSMRAALDQPVVGQRDMLTQVDGLTLLNTPIIDVEQRSGVGARPEADREWSAGLARLGLERAEIDELLGRGVLVAAD